MPAPAGICPILPVPSRLRRLLPWPRASSDDLCSDLALGFGQRSCSCAPSTQPWLCRKRWPLHVCVCVPCRYELARLVPASSLLWQVRARCVPLWLISGVGQLPPKPLLSVLLNYNLDDVHHQEAAGSQPAPALRTQHRRSAAELPSWGGNELEWHPDWGDIPTGVASQLGWHPTVCP